MPSVPTHAFLSHTATTYPYVKESDSFLFVDGAAFPYQNVNGGLTEDALVTIPGGHQRSAAEVLTFFHEADEISSNRTAVIAYGANAAVDVLTRKFVTSADYAGSGVVPVTKVRLQDIDVVWAPHFVGNGAMPATVAPSPGAQPDIWITWLDDQQIERMHESESVSKYYSFGTLDRKCIAASDVELTADPMLYVDCFGAFRNAESKVLAVKETPVTNRTLPQASALEAMGCICPIVNWDGATYELIIDNLKNPEAARAREALLRDRSDQTPIPGYQATIACSV